MLQVRLKAVSRWMLTHKSCFTHCECMYHYVNGTQLPLWEGSQIPWDIHFLFYVSYLGINTTLETTKI